MTLTASDVALIAIAVAVWGMFLFGLDISG